MFVHDLLLRIVSIIWPHASVDPLTVRMLVSAIPSSSVLPLPTSAPTPRSVPVSLPWVSLVVPPTPLSKVPSQIMLTHGDRSSFLLLDLFL